MIILSKPSNFPFYFINGELPEKILSEIDDELSYYVKNYEWITGWDGRVRLFHKSARDNWFFPVGLIERVEAILILNNIPYKTQEYFNDYKSYNFIWKGPPLRLYQQEAIDKLNQNKNNSGIISLPTGSGKTIIGLFFAFQKKSPFMVLVHRKELLYQWADEIKLNLGISAGLIGDGIDEWNEICTVAMVQTLNQKIKNKSHFMQFPLIIFDECHTIPADTAFKVAMRLLPKYRLGLSATPYREDNADKRLYGAVGPLTSNITPEKLVNQGYLAKPKFTYLKSDPIKISSEFFYDIYEKGIVLNDNRNKLISETAKNLIKNERLLYIHVDRIKHGLILKKLIPGSAFVSGKSKDRSELISMFSKGDLSCLISTLLKEGVNIPNMDALIYAAGKKSAVATIQTIGRVLRPQVGKKDALIFDIADCGTAILRSHFIQRRENYIKVFGNFANEEICYAT